MAQRFSTWILTAALAAVSSAPAARAQTPPPAPAVAADADPSFLTPPPQRDVNPLLQKTRDYQGVPLAGWMFYPEMLVQGIYNDNLGLTSTAPRAAAGMRFNPDLYALHDDGVSKTEIYGAAAADVYPTAPRDDEVNGAVGVAETYKIAPDLIVKGQAQFDRLGGYGVGGDVIGPGGLPTPLVAPSESNRAQASAGVQKSFGRFFLGAAVNVAATRYDPLATAVGALSQSYRDSVVTTLTERAGYWVSPLFYAYAETAENAREYAQSNLRSDGLRAVAGLGTDRLGLMRGEAYAGWQTQFYAAPLPASASSPVLGAKLYWYPSRALTLTAAVDESFTDSSNPEPGNPRGDPARDVSAALDANYQLHRRWSAYALARVDRIYAIGAPRVDTAYLGTLRISYELMRNLDLSLSYAYTRVDSNAAGGSYVDDVASLGARFRF